MSNNIKGRILTITITTTILSLYSLAGHSMPLESNYVSCAEAYRAAPVRYVGLEVACPPQAQGVSNAIVPSTRGADQPSQNPLVRKYRQVIVNGVAIQQEYWERQNPNGMNDTQAREAQEYLRRGHDAVASPYDLPVTNHDPVYGDAQQSRDNLRVGR